MATYDGPDRDTPVYVISVAAQLAGMHAQTLRQYDRLGLVTPSRTRGGGRRYSARDIDRLREVQALSADGVSLAGIHRILELETQVEAMRERNVVPSNGDQPHFYSTCSRTTVNGVSSTITRSAK